MALRQTGASYHELAYWLRRKYRLCVDPTTIRRYLVQFPTLHQESAHAELDMQGRSLQGNGGLCHSRRKQDEQMNFWCPQGLTQRQG